jgi:hypothetical protein
LVDIVLSAVPVHPWSKESRYQLSGLKLAGGHLARLLIALKLVPDFLTFDDFTHTSALHGRNMNEGVFAAVIGLNKAEALGGIEPFNCASGHDEPFHSNIEETRDTKAPQMEIAIFEREGSFKARC